MTDRLTGMLAKGQQGAERRLEALGRKLTPRRWVRVRVALILALLPLALLAPVLAGAVGVGIVLLGWAPALVGLVIALRPLFLPTLAVALIGAVDLPTGWQLLIGGSIGLLVVPWVARDWAASGRVIVSATEAVFKGLKALGLALLFAVVVLTVLRFWPATRDGVGGSLEAIEQFGGVPIVLALVAAVLVAVALLFRVAGFMRTRARIVTAVVLLVGTLRAIMDVELLPGGSTFSWLPTATVMAVGGALLVLLLALEVRWPVERPSDPNRNVLQWLSSGGLSKGSALTALRHGLGVSIAAMVLLVLALAWGWIEVDSGTGELSQNGRRAEQPPQPPGQMTDDELRQAFLPVLSFSKDQRWAPQKVDDYVRQAELTPVPPAGVEQKGGLPVVCRDGELDPCYQLRCASAAEPCAHSEDFSERRGRFDDGAVYVRVVHRDKPPADRSPPAFDVRIGPFGKRLTTLVQYWFFYPFDEWKAPVALGRLVQSHAGDWEAVTVGLSEEEPLFVAYSEHCGGRWARWRRVLAANDPRPHTHPLVAVAVGSQANYERAAASRAPDFTSCRGVPGESIQLLSYVWNIRDRTGADWELLPKQVVPVDATTAPMTFPGTWGAEDRTVFVGFGDKELGKGAGPRTPSRQPLWREPVRQIFCGKAWRGPQRVRCPPR